MILHLSLSEEGNQAMLHGGVKTVLYESLLVLFSLNFGSTCRTHPKNGEKENNKRH